MTDWIEHNGGPQPVGDDVWVATSQRHGLGEDSVLAGALDWRHIERSRDIVRYRILNQHLIDAARLEGIQLGLEAAARACLDQREAFMSPQYATDQPLSSIQERFACGECINGIRAIDPAVIAREATDQHDTKRHPAALIE